MIDYWDFWLDGYDAPGGGSGMATTLPVDWERDRVAELRKVVEEVTGKPLPERPKARIGFL